MGGPVRRAARVLAPERRLQRYRSRVLLLGGGFRRRQRRCACCWCAECVRPSRWRACSVTPDLEGLRAGGRRLGAEWRLDANGGPHQVNELRVRGETSWSSRTSELACAVVNGVPLSRTLRSRHARQRDLSRAGLPSHPEGPGGGGADVRAASGQQGAEGRRSLSTCGRARRIRCTAAPGRRDTPRWSLPPSAGHPRRGAGLPGRVSRFSPPSTRLRAGSTASAGGGLGSQALPYLVSRRGPRRRRFPRYLLASKRFPGTTLGRALAPLGIDVGQIGEVRVIERSPSGRAQTVQVRGREGEAQSGSARALREALGMDGDSQYALPGSRDRGPASSSSARATGTESA